MREWHKCGVALLMAVSFLFVSGCAGGNKTTTKTYTDPETLQKQEVTTTETSTFWKSENQQMGYEVMEKKIDKGAEVALAKLEQIERNAARRSQMSLSPEARAYADALDTVVTAQIRPDVPVGDIPIAKNAADFIGPNAVALAYAGISLTGALLDLDIGGPFGGTANGEGNASLDGVTVGRDLYVQSERSDQYNLAEDSAYNTTESTSLSWYTETHTGTSENSGQDGTATANVPSDEEIGLF